MKKFNSLKAAILILTFSFGFIQGDSQQVATADSKETYLLKSNHQKTAAFILLSAGFTTTITGFVIGVHDGEKFVADFFTLSPNDGKTDGTAIIIAGVALMAGSVPFFISSRKNTRKAFSVSFQNLRTPGLTDRSLVYRNSPSLKLIIHL